MPQKSFKTRIDVGDQSTWQASTSWTSFARVLEIKPPGLKSDSIETTHLESADEMREWEPGLGDAGESTFKLQWDAAQNATVMGLFRVKRGFRVVYSDQPYPSGSKLRFTAFVEAIENETIQKDNVVEAMVTVRVIGKPDFQAAS